MIELVAPDRERWEPLPGEPEDAYLAFLSWAHRSPRPPPPTQLADAYQWQQRAHALDARTAMPHDEGDLLRGTMVNLLRMAFLESRKHVRVSEGSAVPAISVRELVQLVACLRDVRMSLAELLDAEEDVDLSNLSDAQVAQLRDVMLEVRRVTG